jgi:hypothetical protein
VSFEQNLTSAHCNIFLMLWPLSYCTPGAVNSYRYLNCDLKRQIDMPEFDTLIAKQEKF